MVDIISDEEWAQFLQDNYRHVEYQLPTKDTTVEFLEWRIKRIKEKWDKQTEINLSRMTNDADKP